jgi:16S rRNA (cytosine967-C5)-methyltransferase
MGGSLESDGGDAGLKVRPSPSRPRVKDPRRAAFRILADVRSGKHADRAAERRLQGLAGSDRALALELAFGTVRLRARLDFELERLSSRPLDRLDPPVVDWLRLGLYQLRELRIPDHAAVHESVSGVRQTVGPGPTGFVNAILRRAASEGRPDMAFPAPDEDPVAFLSTYGSHPEWLVRRWLARWPLASVRRLVENDNRAPPVTLRLLRKAQEPPVDLSPARGVRLEALDVGRDMFRLVEGEPAEAMRHLTAVVQDPAAAAVVDYVGGRIEGPVLDVCAAPGGKAVALASLAPGARPFVAADLSRDRLRRVADGVSRARADVRTVVMDGRAPAIRSARTVLVDAPCTGTGTLRRRPDSRWRLTPGRLRSLVALQNELLDACSGLVAPGGLLVYATCSIEPEENEEQVEEFLGRHPFFERDSALRDVPEWMLSGRGDLEILPWTADTDGAFASRLRRRGKR